MTLPRHVAALAKLRSARVDFLMVGAGALDHFVPEAASVYVTADCDLLLRPTAANVGRALRALRACGYALSAGEEPLAALDALALRRLRERRLTVRAEKADSLPLDLLLEAKGYTFAQWWKGRVWFRAGRTRIPCASLEQVLESKRLSDRPKDRLLLALFKDRFGGKDASRRRNR
jgi:hypothetical protein